MANTEEDKLKDEIIVRAIAELSTVLTTYFRVSEDEAIEAILEMLVKLGWAKHG